MHKSSSSPDNSSNTKKPDQDDKNLSITPSTPKLSIASKGDEEQKDIFPLPKPYQDRNRPETSFLGFISNEIAKIEVLETKRRSSMKMKGKELDVKHMRSEEILQGSQSTGKGANKNTAKSFVAFSGKWSHTFYKRQDSLASHLKQEKRDSCQDGLSDVRTDPGLHKQLYEEAEFNKQLRDIRTAFPEYRQVNNNELELILYLHEENIKSPLQTTSPPFYVSGALMMWIFFLFCGSTILSDVNLRKIEGTETYVLPDKSRKFFLEETSQKNMMVLIVCGAIGGVCHIFLRERFYSEDSRQRFGSFYLCNSMLAGVISVSSCLDSLSLGGGAIVATIGSVIYFILSKTYLRLHLDDPLESSIVYGWIGFYSTTIVGFIDADNGVIPTKSVKLLFVHFGGALTIAVFTALLTLALVLVIRAHRRFRFGQIFEVVGLNNLIQQTENRLLSF